MTRVVRDANPAQAGGQSAFELHLMTYTTPPVSGSGCSPETAGRDPPDQERSHTGRAETDCRDMWCHAGHHQSGEGDSQLLKRP